MARHPWVRSDAYPDRWTAVYRLYDANDRLLYVGIGYDYLARWKAHAKKDWWPQVARKEVIWYDNRLTAAWEETKAILTENPVHNDHPGLSLVNLIVFRARDLAGRFWDRGEPVMTTSDWMQDEVFRDVRDRGTHAAIAIEDEVVGFVVPWRYYVEACAAMGDLEPQRMDAEFKAAEAARREAERVRRAALRAARKRERVAADES